MTRPSAPTAEDMARAPVQAAGRAARVWSERGGSVWVGYRYGRNGRTAVHSHAMAAAQWSFLRRGRGECGTAAERRLNVLGCWSAARTAAPLDKSELVACLNILLVSWGTVGSEGARAVEMVVR